MLSSKLSIMVKYRLVFFWTLKSDLIFAGLPGTHSYAFIEYWDQYTHSKLISTLCALIVSLIYLIHNGIYMLHQYLKPLFVSSKKTHVWLSDR